MVVVVGHAGVRLIFSFFLVIDPVLLVMVLVDVLVVMVVVVMAV